MPMAGREFKLRKAVEELEGRYDVVVFDAPPSFGLLNLNALMAAPGPLRPGAARLPLLPRPEAALRDGAEPGGGLNHVLDHVFIVVNAYNQTYKLAREALAALRQHYPEYLLTTLVRQCTSSPRPPARECRCSSPSAIPRRAHDVDAFLKEVLHRLEQAKARAVVDARGPGEGTMEEGLRSECLPGQAPAEAGHAGPRGRGPQSSVRNRGGSLGLRGGGAGGRAGGWPMPRQARCPPPAS